MTRKFAMSAFTLFFVSCGDNIGGPAVFDAPDDGQPPEACRSWCYDHDRDGRGDPNTVATICGVPAGYTLVCDDCDDGLASVYPGATEICGNGRREDCNRIEDLACEQSQAPDAGPLDSSDAGVCGVCADAGLADVGFTPADAGSASDAGPISVVDAGPEDAGASSPDAGDPCPVANRTRWYRDADADGYGRDDQFVEACASVVIGYSKVSGDCDDTNTSIHTGCVVADAGSSQSDAGVSEDAGSSADAGAPVGDAGSPPVVDAGTLTDAGPVDAGVLEDAGFSVDAGSSLADAGDLVDAGTVSDAGTIVDAGVLADAGAGSITDAGSPADAGTPPDAWSSYVYIQGRSIVLSATGMISEPFMSALAFIVGTDNGTIDWTFRARNSVTPASGAFTLDFTDLVKWPPGFYEFTLVSSVNGASPTLPDISAVVRWWENDDLCRSGTATARTFCARQPRPTGQTWDNYLLRVQVTQTGVVGAGTL